MKNVKSFEQFVNESEEFESIVEGNLAIDDKDGEILNIALQLAAGQLKKFRMSSDEKKRLERLLNDFNIAYGDGRPYTDTSSPVDGLAKQLDRR